MTLDNELSCAKCASRFDAAAILDHCTTGWIPQEWLYFRCPDCRKYSHVAVEPDKLSIGELDGAPGPCFFPSSTVAAPGIRFASLKRRITVHFAGRKWNFNAR